MPRLQAGAGGQYDSRAHSHPRAGAGATGGAAQRERDPARRRREGTGARSRDDDPGAALHGPARGGGGLMQHFAQQMVEMFRLELFLQLCLATLFGGAIGLRSEERRVGEEGRSRGAPYHLKKKKKK